MKERRPSTPSLGMQLAALFFRRLVLCGICGKPIERREDCEWDHTHEHADGGKHEVKNLRPVHDKVSGGCHKRKSAKAETQRHHIERLEKSRLESPTTLPPAALKVCNEPGTRCRGCGQYPESCTCTKPAPKKLGWWQRRSTQNDTNKKSQGEP